MGLSKKGRILLVVFVATLIAAFAVVGGGGWYMSNLLRDGGLLPDHEPDPLDLEVVGVGNGRITFSPGPETDEDGRWSRNGLFGLERADGYDQVGEIVSVEDEQVVRRYLPITGGVRIGDMARVDSYAFPDNPQEAFGLEFEEVFYSSPLGQFPAWFVEGDDDTWAIMVHGRTANRGEALRMLPTVVDAGLPALVIAYRNGEGLPADPSGFYQYGLTEGADLEGAVRYALEHGARDIVLVGYSMGGGVVANFLYESDLSDVVRGAVLDSPMLDFGATVDLGAANRGYPGIVSGLAKAFAGFRFDVDWEATNYLARADQLKTPILLFHGDEDPTVPISTSDRLKELRPDIVEYVKVEGADHVGAWNKDRQAYEAAVGRFLARVSR